MPDGFWGNIRGARLFQYHFGGRFSDKSMGSGSEPTYVVSGKHVDCGSLSVLHMGFLQIAMKFGMQAILARWS